MSGYIYILSNPAFNNLLKIGFTNETIEERMKQLNTTGVPLPFILEAAFLVQDAITTEQHIHTALAEFRLESNREFFKIQTSEAPSIIFPIIIIINGTATTEKNITQKKKLSIQPSNDEINILQIITSIGKDYGTNKYSIQRHCELDELELSIITANLLAHKLISKRRNQGYSDSNWATTPRGIKFLADNNLIDDWMKETFNSYY